GSERTRSKTDAPPLDPADDLSTHTSKRRSLPARKSRLRSAQETHAFAGFATLRGSAAARQRSRKSTRQFPPGNLLRGGAPPSVRSFLIAAANIPRTAAS